MFLRKNLIARILSTPVPEKEINNYTYQETILTEKPRPILPGENFVVGYTPNLTPMPHQAAKQLVREILLRAAVNHAALHVEAAAPPVYTLRYLGTYSLLRTFGIMLPSALPQNCTIASDPKKTRPIAKLDVGQSLFYPYHAVWDHHPTSLLGSMHSMAKYYGGIKITTCILPDGILVLCIKRSGASFHEPVHFKLSNGITLTFNTPTPKRQNIRWAFLSPGKNHKYQETPQP